MNKLLFIFLIVLLVFGCQRVEVNIVDNTSVVQEQELNETIVQEKFDDNLDLALYDISSIDSIDSREVKVFRVKVANLSFDPAVMQVNKGDYVVMNITSLDITYDIEAADFGIDRELLYPGRTKTIEFIAEKEGNFRLLCTLQCRPRIDVNVLLIVK